MTADRPDQPGRTASRRPPRVLTGIGVGRGVAVAPLVVLAPPPSVPADEPSAADPASALARIEAAFQAVGTNLAARAAATDGALADILDATASMADDPAMLAAVRRHLDEGHGPATAVTAAAAGFADALRAAGGRVADRVTDLNSVRDRVVARLLGLGEPTLHDTLDGPFVVAAADLAPADAAALDPSRIVAIVTEQGGPLGHTAIVAGQLGLPCVVRVAGITDVPAGTVVAVDASAGTVTSDPPPEQVAATTARRNEVARTLSLDTAPGATADGTPVALLANVGTHADTRRAVEVTAEGIGLLRTELLFTGRHTAPTVEEQTAAYRQVLEPMAGRRVIVRTLDVGADKPLPFLDRPSEVNPALGVRGVRLDRTHPQLEADQLTALGAVVAELPAHARSDLWVMAPMVATTAEAARFVDEARAHGIRTVGAMVEVPSAALQASAVLAELDFASVGTNDLAQYTMAADRMVGDLADLLDLWQPAVLELVARTIRAGVELDKPVGICGESAGDPLMALVLVGMGATSLSMSPAAMPTVRHCLRAHPIEICREMAAVVWDADDAATARTRALGLADPEVVALLGLR
ncbi:MAG: putative PEP-binding protein [Actinomycetota bacterium]